jgi:hypothetical protein
MGSFRLMYRSRNRIPADERKAELGDLFTGARRFNKEAGISGALLLHGDTFVQLLEGDESAVRSLYSRIETDPRHDEVELLEARDVDDAVFRRWAMARVGDEGEADIRLIAHADGVHPAAPKGTTPEQDVLLADMRAAVRSGG